MNKILVLYVFHIYNNRVKYFIDNCIFKDDNIDFLIICNNKNINFNAPNYVKIIIRDNLGCDFGGWSHGLLDDNIYQNYDKFIFVNSSVSGPYLKDKNIKWTDIYINGLQNNIKLFGSTINSYYNNILYPHVQSYIFSMNKETLEFLIKCNIFSVKEYTSNIEETILYKEIEMSNKIIKNGWNIGSLLKQYKDVDFTKDISHIKLYDDIMFPIYRNILWSEDDLVFIKGNRMGL